MDKLYLGLDLSLSSPGFSVIALDEYEQPLILETSHVKTDSKKSHGYRLDQIHDQLVYYFYKYGPFEAVIREKGFSRFPATTQTLFKVVGISDYVAHQYGYEKIHEISPTSVKKLVTGKGKADKLEVERCVRELLRIDRADFFKNDDESDSAAVALAYLIQTKVIEH